MAGLILRILTRARRADVGRGFLRCFDLFSSSCRDAPVGATAVPTHAPLHGIRRRGVGPPGDGFLCAFLCLSFVISLVRHTSWDRPGRRAKRGACNVPSLRGLRTGKTGKNVRRHDPDRSNASMIKQKKMQGRSWFRPNFLETVFRGQAGRGGGGSRVSLWTLFRGDVFWRARVALGIVACP